MFYSALVPGIEINKFHFHYIIKTYNIDGGILISIFLNFIIKSFFKRGDINSYKEILLPRGVDL